MLLLRLNMRRSALQSPGAQHIALHLDLLSMRKHLGPWPPSELDATSGCSTVAGVTRKSQCGMASSVDRCQKEKEKSAFHSLFPSSDL